MKTLIRDEYRGALHHHHAIEDEMLWALLHERASVHDDIVDRMESQHVHLDETLTAIEKLVPAWTNGATEPARDDLAAALSEHRSVLLEHLDDERAARNRLIDDSR